MDDDDSCADVRGDLGLAAAAGRVTEAAFAGLAGDVVDDAIIPVRADAVRHRVQSERLPDPPSDVVVGARGVSRDEGKRAAQTKKGRPKAARIS
jgi:hypothetical protein